MKGKLIGTGNLNLLIFVALVITGFLEEGRFLLGVKAIIT